MPRTNVEIAEEILERFNREGVRATLEYAHPDVEIHPFPEWPGPDRYDTHAGLVRLAEEWYENFDEYTWVPDQFVEAGECVVVCGRQSGTAKGAGVRVEQTVAGVWRFEGGLIVRMDYFMTWDEALEFAGAKDEAG